MGADAACPSCGALTLPSQPQCERCAYPLVGMASSRPVPREDERRHLTVLFCDLVNYSSLAEKLDLEQQTELVREYRRIATEVIRRFGGFVAQYLGDGLLSYFGYPLSHEDSAERAINAGLAMVRAIETLGSRWPEQNIDIRARVGVHAGIALIGHEQLAVGPTVNCASRVQERAQPGAVLVTGAVYRIARGYFDFVDQGAHALKGFAKPFTLYEVRGPTGARDRVEAGSSRGLAPFVDRDNERGVLRECWRNSNSAMSSVLLTGEAGIGKSRTLHEFLDEIRADHPTVLEARCSEMHRSSALFPLLELVRADLGWAPSWSPEHTRAELTSRLGDSNEAGLEAELLAALLAPGEDDITLKFSLAPLLMRERALAAIADWISTRARERHVLFVLEDLHWADPTTLEACSLLLSRKNVARLMVVASARADFAPHWPLGAPSQVVCLERLPVDVVQKLISALSNAHSLPPNTAQRIVRDSDGNPLFIEEITRDVLEAGSDAQSQAGEDSGVPLTLRNSLRARLDRLGRLKRVAQQAAVLGREFEAGLLYAAFAWEPNEAQPLLARLVDLGVLVPRLDRPGERYEFRHALIHNEAYESLARTVLRDYHAHVADTLVQKFSAIAERDPEMLALHFEKAGRLDDAVRAYHRAGQSAIQRAFFTEALTVFEHALAVLGQIPHSEARDRLEVDVRAGLGLALISTRGFTVPEVENTYQRGVELSERLADTPLRILYGLWAFNMVRGDRYGTARLLPQLERARAHAKNPLEELVTTSCLGSYAFFRADFKRAEELLSHACTLAGGTDPATLNASLLRDYGYEGLLYPHMFLAWMRYFQGRSAECAATVESAVQLAEASRHPYLIAKAYGIAAPIAHDQGQHERAGEIADKLLVISQENRFPYWLASGLCVKGLAVAQAGQRAEGIVLLEQGLLLFKTIGAFLVYPYYMTYLGRVLIEDGRLEDASEIIDEALAIADRAVNTSLSLSLAFVQAEIALRRGNAAESFASFTRILASPTTEMLSALGLRVALRIATLPPAVNPAPRADRLKLLDTWMAAVRDCPELDLARRVRASLG